MSSSALKNGDDSLVDADDFDPHFEPILSLPEVDLKTLEEEEIVLIQQRAKLFRRDTVEKEWKERGTGDAKLLHNVRLNTVRVVMRRDKTYKLCANHYVTQDMILKPSCGSDRAWVWTTMADASDEVPKVQILAIRFMSADAAKKWKDKFEEAKSLIALSYKTDYPKEETSDGEDKATNSSDSSADSSVNNSCDEELNKDIASISLKDESVCEDKLAETTKETDKAKKE